MKMKYFLILVDKDYIAPTPIGWYGKINKKLWQEKKAYEMPKHLIFDVEKHMQMVFTDIITFPCFMVSKMVRDVIRQYSSFIKFTRVILYDKERKKSMAYYIPILESINSIKKNVMNGNNSDLISIESEKLEDKVIIEIYNMNKFHTIMRIDLLESILRRGAIGISVKEIHIV